jgi:predicted DsbA family dithiol-disulfide isomerase
MVGHHVSVLLHRETQAGNALEKFPFADNVEVVWKSFLLNPDMVTDPNKSTLEYLSETKGWSMAQLLRSQTRW